MFRFNRASIVFLVITVIIAYFHHLPLVQPLLSVDLSSLLTSAGPLGSTPPTQLVIQDLVETVQCDRPSQRGDTLFMAYVGAFWQSDGKGNVFDQSGENPFQFRLGAGQVIAGWDQGLEGMCQGQVRRLIIPYDLAYGEQGYPPIIPATTTPILTSSYLYDLNQLWNEETRQSIALKDEISTKPRVYASEWTETLNEAFEYLQLNEDATSPSQCSNLLEQAFQSQQSKWFPLLASHQRRLPMLLSTAAMSRLLGHWIAPQSSLYEAVQYVVQGRGKALRPLLVLLLGEALKETQNQEHYKINAHVQWDMDQRTSLDYEQALLDANSMTCHHRLADIVELMHLASLCHDDVLDDAEIRRQQKTLNATRGSKKAILAGDYLLARASVSLARLGNADAMEGMATALADLVEGEMLQMEMQKNQQSLEAVMAAYVEKTYRKTASLIARACQCAAALWGHAIRRLESQNRQDTFYTDSAYLYGKYLGMAFQLTDDTLDFTKTSEQLGKPADTDLKLGLTTAPVLLIMMQNKSVYQQIWPLLERQYRGVEDVSIVKQAVLEHQGVEMTKMWARIYSTRAIKAIQHWPDSEAKQILQRLAQSLVDRGN